jgi:hypothetical protein
MLARKSMCGVYAWEREIKQQGWGICMLPAGCGMAVDAWGSFIKQIGRYASLIWIRLDLHHLQVRIYQEQLDHDTTNAQNR